MRVFTAAFLLSLLLSVSLCVLSTKNDVLIQLLHSQLHVKANKILPHSVCLSCFTTVINSSKDVTRHPGTLKMEKALFHALNDVKISVRTKTRSNQGVLLP